MISYGYSVKENDDPLVNLVESAVHQFSECSEPGAFMVDVVPLRKSRFLYQPIAGDTNCIFSLIQSIPVIDPQLRPDPSCTSCFFDWTGMYHTHGMDSAIRARLVPWSGVENESQIVCERVD